MSASAPTLPPTGQRHDREDAEMHEGEGLANGREQLEQESTVPAQASTNAVAVEVAVVDEDAMDTTSDTDQQLVLPNGSVGQSNITTAQPQSPAANDTSRYEVDSSVQTDPAAAADDATQTEPPPSIIPLPLFDPDLQPPPPPPPPVEPVRSDSESSDEEDGMHPWHPIQEDTSSPDEFEMKEIEASTEHSALDHEYWESRAYLPVDEPEYTVGVSGRIDWTIDRYNGTREQPNRDIVMKSDVVTIGGHQWQIKFYPRGNDSDYLSVYLECLSVVDPSSKKKDGRVDSVVKDAAVDATRRDEKAGSPVQAAVVEHQYTPLPLLGSKQLPKRESVAAQVSVVMYNPTEPRVNYSRTALHRFCGGSPDWGWTRFHGPYYDIPHRLRGQRQALLRNDKLAFTGYIRIIEDETDCLWEHHSRENPWDSFAMTGLQGLMLGEDASAPGGNMISAIASWMLFKPFRELLYSAHAPVPEEEPFMHPKPLLSALKKVLYMLRTQVDPGAGAVALDDVLDALEWYGIHERIDKLDVIETWEVLRAKLEEELQGTLAADTLAAMCGPKRNYSIGVPSYKVPVIGVESMQGAIDKSTDLMMAGHELPQLLTVELERQEFDSKTRSYVKLLNKVSLDDHIYVRGVPYTLYGFVVHKQTLQSCVYQPILRPEGPESRWYSYSDSKDENRVRCLTRKEAVDVHEGKPGPGRLEGNDPVAYIAMYVRDDIADVALKPGTASEPWEVPRWIKVDVERTRRSSILDPLPPPPPMNEPATMTDGEDPPVERDIENESKLVEFQVIDSRLFLQHEGPGTFEAYGSKWKTDDVEHVYTIQLARDDSCDDIRNKIASVIENIKDPRQVKFWFLDPLRGSQGRPHLSTSGKMEYSSGSYDRYLESKEWKFDRMHYACRRLWTHIVDHADLPAPPQGDGKDQETTEGPPASTDDNIVVIGAGPDIEGSAEVERSEDTPMSEPDEPEPEPEAPVQSRPQTPTVAPPVTIEGNDTMVDDVPADSERVEALIPVLPAVHDDIEMGGTQGDLPPAPPPPPPVDRPTEFMPTPPPPVERAPSPALPADEIYFFLKFFSPEKQTLEARGTYIVKKSARVDETLVTCLGLPMEDKKRIDIWEEEELNNLRSIKNRRTFLQVDLHNTSVIIVAMPQTTEQRSALAARAAFADPQSFLAYRGFARNFPSHLNGHFTYNYFSSEYYRGEIKNGHRHGHGKMFYHSGATYEGTFQLGQRHGHGLYTFQNGDTYDGDWADNQQHGSGTFIEAATGNTYVGGWKNDKKFGEGVTHWKNAQEEERLCRICWEDAADAAFYDCGHVVACLQCAKEVQNCPVCRKRVLCAMKLYYVA
ncbi:ubiquitin carboxyl-terminal hydrolase [Didymella heteroderae]|uniref:Ubiquitin carboxyl-terminal hydrolase n=1 Tax=Didymella heteroderae TaxID=1769908 RepID=A0A9P4WTG5_9PLEO|nr:ubiquitin carboxyl-terminal hydrolase [Didymella heteroderae]